MWSTVMKNQQTLNLLPILALASVFIRISGSIALQPVLIGPDAAYLSTRVTFRCIEADSSLPVTYELIRDGSVLIAVDAGLQGDQKALFSLKVTATSQGSYHCKATTDESTGVSNSIRLSVVTPASNTRVTSDPFPPVAYEGSRMALSCSVAKGSHLFYTWFFNRREVTSLTSPPLLLTGNKLVMEKVAPEHAGSYSCMAWSKVQDTRRFSSSLEAQMTVKVYLSKPRISYSIFKEGASRYGNVTCWATRGSPPVNISLSVNDKEVGSVTGAQSLVAWFPVAMAPRQDMAVARCQVKTEVQELMSEPVTLEMVPVGGHVKLEVEYLYSADSKLVAAKLSCQVSRGTFPYISWLLNNSSRPPETHADSHDDPVRYHGVLADRRRTLFLAKLGPEESGYYLCRARDSYNDSGAWVESAAVLVEVTEVYLNTIEVLTVVFCCFFFLMLAVGAGCVYKMFDQKHAHSQLGTTNSDAFPLSAHTSQSGGRQDDTGSIVDFENQGCASAARGTSTLGRPRLIGPSEALLNSIVEFHCEIDFSPKNETVLFQLVKKGNRKLLGEYTSLSGEVAVIPQVIKLSHDGYLECVAKAQNNSNIEPTISHTQYLRVIAPVKGATVALRSSPRNHFEGETLHLSCELMAGNYVSYKWLLNGQLVSPSLYDVADKNLFISRTTTNDSGHYMCVATNHFKKKTIFTSNSSEVQITIKGRGRHSQRIPLKVVPVGGPVRMLYDYDVENYAVIGVRFYCRAAKGSLPQYRWFLNTTLLGDRGSFYSVADQPPEQSILLLSVGRSSAGTYRCDVSDSFDSNSSISSNALYLDTEVLNRLPVLVVAVVFGCFTCLVVLVSICCLVGAIFKRRQYGGNSLLSLEMKGLAAACEDELDSSEYNEDADFVKAAADVEFDQASAASSEEWPRIEEEEDESVNWGP